VAIAASDRAFLGVAALLFAGSAAATIALSARAGTPICGGGTMAWPPLPGAASFLIMWVAMTAAMMLPSLMPVLWRYRRALGGPECDRLTALVGAGYFCVWTAIGLAVFPLAMVLPALLRALPPMAGVVVLAAGVLQFTAWKAHHLACCRLVPAADSLPTNADTAWRHGLRLGLHCSLCSIGPTAVLLVLGMMDLGAMVAVTVAVTIERLAPAGERTARRIGVILVGVGMLLVAGFA
jgi:predicted metal-binding membrane protein